MDSFNELNLLNQFSHQQQALGQRIFMGILLMSSCGLDPSFGSSPSLVKKVLEEGVVT